MTTISDLTKTGALLNGMLASNLTILIVHPIFTLKTFMMTKGHLPHMSQAYLGLAENLICDATNQMAGFLGIKIFSDAIGVGSRELTEKEGFLGGMFAGVLTSPLLSYTERMMILDQVGKKSPLNASPLMQRLLPKKACESVRLIKHIWQKEGMRGFIRGTSLTTCRESSNMACFFGLQKVLESQVKKAMGEMENMTSSASKTSAIISSLSYGVVGVFSGLITTPFDFIKTRVQAEIGGSGSAWQKSVSIVKDHGLRTLFTGGVARMGTIGATWLVLGPVSKQVRQMLLDTTHFRKSHDN